MGSRDELADYLRRHPACVGEFDDVWAGVRLRFRAHLASEPPPRAFVGSVRAIVHRAGHVLVVYHHAEERLWVGGRPEPGETIEAALVREVAEETGLLVEPRAVVLTSRSVVEARRDLHELRREGASANLRRALLHRIQDRQTLDDPHLRQSVEQMRTGPRHDVHRRTRS